MVLVVKSDDTDCYGTPTMIPSRNKQVILTINASITKRDYIIASGIVVCVIFSFCITYVVSTVISKIKRDRQMKEEILNQESEHINEPIPSPSTIEEVKQKLIFFLKYYFLINCINYITVRTSIYR